MLLAIEGGALVLAAAYRPLVSVLPFGVVALAILARPRIAQQSTRVIDLALAAVLAAIALQLVPLPAGLRQAVAPSAITYEQTTQVTLPGAPPAGPGPVSVHPDSTASALFVVAQVIVIFWSARTLFQRGGVRMTIRAIACAAILIGPIALAQHATAPRLLFWRWRPAASNALPFSPFVNRNEFAGWLVMALPLIAGYAITRIQSRQRAGERLDPESVLDNTGVLLAVSLFLMTAALLASLSRSGLAGGFAGLTLLVLLARGRMSARSIAWMVVGLIAMVGLAAIYAANTGALAARLNIAVSEGMAGRMAIWRQTWPMVRDFWPTGSGVGTYQPVMLLYQTSSRLFYINHADNEYLQILAEGGALLAIPVALVLVAGAAAIARQLRADCTPMFWIRAGAVCGILAIGVQNLVEMTLRVPANGILVAILAAIALHGDRSVAFDARERSSDLRRGVESTQKTPRTQRSGRSFLCLP